MYYNVSVLLDGSESAEVVLQYLPSFVCSSGTGRVTLLRVSNDTAESGEYLSKQAGRIVNEWHLDSCAVPVIDTKPVPLAHNDVADTIANFVNTNDVDAIMLVTGGSSGVDWWRTGSIAQQIINGACVPVYLARLGSGRHPRPGIIQSILLPLDGSLLSEQALPFAEHIAVNAPAKVNLLSVQDNKASQSSRESSEAAYSYTETAKYLDTISDSLKQSVENVSTSIREGLAGQQIAEMAQDGKFDLIVMSSHGHTGPGRGAFGGVTESVLHGCHVPVLVIPPKLNTPEVREDAT